MAHKPTAKQIAARERFARLYGRKGKGKKTTGGTHMAKKKKKGKKGKVTADRAVPLGAAMGAAVTGLKLASDTSYYGGNFSVAQGMVGLVKGTSSATNVVASTRKALSTPKNYIPLVAGAALSVAPKVPLVRIVAKPLDRAVRRLTHGKAGM